MSRVNAWFSCGAAEPPIECGVMCGSYSKLVQVESDIDRAAFTEQTGATLEAARARLEDER